MKLLNLLFLGLLSSSLITAYPSYPAYPVVVYEPAPVYYTPSYFPPVNVYTPPVIASPYYVDYYDCPYCYNYGCYQCTPSTGKTLAALGVLGLSVIALSAIFND